MTNVPSEREVGHWLTEIDRDQMVANGSPNQEAMESFIIRIGTCWSSGSG